MSLDFREHRCTVHIDEWLPLSLMLMRKGLHTFALCYGCGSEVVSESEEENARPHPKGLTSLGEGTLWCLWCSEDSRHNDFPAE